MKVIDVDNVNEAYVQASNLMKKNAVTVKSRGMFTLEYPEPVTTVYRNPRERVCLLPERDANPFFHLMEALWILSGRNDVAWLVWFNKRMREYSDDGFTFHAPYGYRMRHNYGMDQIDEAIKLLKSRPDTRQAVITIWDPRHDLNKESKDIPCNDMIFLKIRNGRLNMTVCCRSNDMIWGAYGANVVQFSMLQEYIAMHIGVAVGVYRQVSDSFHIYPDNPHWEKLRLLPYSDFNPYKYWVKPIPLISGDERPEDWDEDLTVFMEVTDSVGKDILDVEFSTYWFRNVASPMYGLWFRHKVDGDAIKFIDSIAASDWREAAKLWLSKRENNNVV